MCLHNLRKTFRYGGRKNVPSIEEIAAISAGRNSKRQMYRLPGGTERVINTRSTTVVDDIIEDICSVLGVTDPLEMEEFSLYCIVEGGKCNVFNRRTGNMDRFRYRSTNHCSIAAHLVRPDKCCTYTLEPQF